MTIWQRLRWLWNYHKYANSRHPSWKVTYADGRESYPQTRGNAESLCKIFGGTMRYCRDDAGDLFM